MLNLTGAPNYESVLKASQDRLRGMSLPSFERTAQTIKNAGLRTSGVGQIPYLQAERNRASGEADILASLAGQRLGQIGSQEAMDKQFQHNLELAKYGWARQQAIAREQANSALMGSLIAGGASLGAGYFMGPR